MSFVGRSVAEVAAVLLTAAAYVVFKRLRCASLWFTGPCIVAWSSYIGWRIRQDRAVLQAWGIRLDNLRQASAPCLAFVAAAALGMLGYRLLRGWRPIPLSFLVILVLYPFWGLLQQFCVQSLFVANLDRLGVRRAAIVPTAAILFGLVHAPNWPLAGLAGAACAVWALLFLRVPNLIPIGLSHGLLGTLAYYLVLGRDPLRHLIHHG